MTYTINTRAFVPATHWVESPDRDARDKSTDRNAQVSPMNWLT